MTERERWVPQQPDESDDAYHARIKDRAAKVSAIMLENLTEVARRAEEQNRVDLGVIEFHSEEANPGLIEHFYAVRDDLTNAACIVDLWLLDIAAVLGEFGYEMRVYRTPEKQRQWEEQKKN